MTDSILSQWHCTCSLGVPASISIPLSHATPFLPHHLMACSGSSPKPTHSSKVIHTVTMKSGRLGHTVPASSFPTMSNASLDAMRLQTLAGSWGVGP